MIFAVKSKKAKHHLKASEPVKLTLPNLILASHSQVPPPDKS